MFKILTNSLFLHQITIKLIIINSILIKLEMKEDKKIRSEIRQNKIYWVSNSKLLNILISKYPPIIRLKMVKYMNDFIKRY